MGLYVDADGRRTVSVEVELPGTPEQVWQAIATGSGLGCWFVPTDVEERQGGKIVFHLDEGMDSAGVVTAWQPPFRLAYEESDWSPGAPPIGTEILIEARSGGVCVMRLVHSLFTDSTRWDGELESMEGGWSFYFEVLRLYLARFAGLVCSQVRLSQGTTGTEVEIWHRLLEELGWTGAAIGSRLSASAAGSRLAGVVDRLGTAKQLHQVLLVLDAPGPGVGAVAAYEWGGKSHAFAQLFLYGDGAREAAEHEGAIWRSWLAERFPAPPAESPEASS